MWEIQEAVQPEEEDVSNIRNHPTDLKYLMKVYESEEYEGKRFIKYDKILRT
ncbi:MAG: hypothetical protein EZS28_018038, partial [Streblomastix strix]